MSKYRVLVVGDLILDVYHVGSVDRISPEAPIPVFEEEYIEYSLGGAGNLVANLSSMTLDKKTSDREIAVDFITHDLEWCDNAQMMSSILANTGVRMIWSGSASSVIEKHRFIDKRNSHQIGLRYDNDRKVLPNRTPLQMSSVKLESINFGSYDAVVFSDYCKKALDDPGFVHHIVSTCRDNGIPTLLDSRRKSLVVFDGVGIFKPNMKEYKEAYEPGRDHVVFKNVLRTESEKGMTLFRDSTDLPAPLPEFHLYSSAKNIVDPTGAGDTAMAGLVYGLVTKMPISDAARLANLLAGEACQNRGTYVVGNKFMMECVNRIYNGQA